MRKSATASSKALLVVPAKKTVTVNSTSNSKWYKCTYNGKTGYIYSKYLQGRTETHILAEALKMRSSMSKANDKNVIKILAKGTKVTVLSKEKNEWLRVSAAGKTGYIKSGHFTDDTSRIGIGAVVKQTKTTKTALNLRKGPSASTKIILVIPANKKVTVTAMEAGGWYKVTYNGKTGYVKGTYLK